MNRVIWVICLALYAISLNSCGGSNSPAGGEPTGGEPQVYDPIAVAKASVGKTENMEAPVPAMCYTKTDGISNPCYVCHTHSRVPNAMDDWRLQEEYSFSDTALTNRWTNLFVDRTEAMAAISDEDALAWIREDNYTPLVEAMARVPEIEHSGFRPDLDFRQGFDDEGFARDGSGWRAFRFKPFLGSFWPTNGNTDDVMIRLPEKFRQTEDGAPSREITKINLAILEAAIQSDYRNYGKNDQLSCPSEPLDEELAGVDLDGDGNIGGVVTTIKGLPTHYVGGAKDEKVERYRYPLNTAFLHTVRYVDPDAPGMISTRMKEVRYMRKFQYLDDWSTSWAYRMELEEKDEGQLPMFTGKPMAGMNNDFGWRLQGWIEDEEGRLRLQTEEEHRFCMGCHSAIGTTVDQTFSFARKMPGANGWGYQDITGMQDVPQAGHAEPEYLEYFKRVNGADEFRANAEMLERFFPNGRLNEQEVLRAAPGGDKDLRFLLYPSRARALQLTKAYMTIVREQSYIKGRDTLLSPVNVHEKIENGDTELGASGKVFKDGRMWLDWSWTPTTD